MHGYASTFSRAKGRTASAALLSLVVLALLPLSDRVAVASRPPAATPAAVPADWWSKVQRDLAAGEYDATIARGVLQAPNRGQNLRTRFRDDRIELTPRAARSSWSWTWRTDAWGREGAMRVPAPASPTASASRVEYRRGALTEWYENREAGLEQGFTIARAPSGGGPVRIEGRLSASLSGRVSEEGALEFRDARGVPLLRYGSLRVTDARGRELPARLELGADRVTIVADDRGAVYPVTIDPLLSSPSWSTELNQVDASYGFSVSTAGDVNGDGFSDVIVGAIFYDHGSFDEGGAFVYHGSALGLSSTASWTGESNQQNGWFGYSVSTAGDVNNDGFDDIVIGTPNYDRSQTATDCGAVWVHLGSDTGVVATAHRMFINPTFQTNGYFGRSVSTAGDVNNDGYSDIVIGAPGQDGTVSADGVVYVYQGSATGLPVSANWSHFGVQAGAFYGVSVAAAGDVNADGYSDILIGASAYDNGQASEGRAYVFLGGAAGPATSPVWTQESNQAGATFGSCVAGAGDVNGDGYADILVSAMGYDNGNTDEGRVSLYLGGASGPSLAAAAALEGGQDSPQFGRQVATAGDVNGDGYADFAIGSPLYDNGQADEGRVFVYYGNSITFWFGASWTEESNLAVALFGLSVATAGDVNGDGYSDLVIGAPEQANGQSGEGRAFLYEGSPARGLATSAWTAEGGQASAHLGFSVASAGDVNADGFGDVIVAAPHKDDGELNEGVVYVYLGTATGLAASPVWIGSGNQAQAQYGYSVSAAGDVNGDGYDDVLVGAPSRTNGQTQEGEAFVYYGFSGGLQVSPAWTGEGNQIGSNYGVSVARAGDVNGDGFGDIVVGADNYDGPVADGGAAFVYLGSAGGLPAAASWTETGAISGGDYGQVVSGAGDVNGDGWSDVLVAAPSEPAPPSFAGVVRCYHGFITGLSHTASWTHLNDATASGLRVALSTAGDVDGDGYSDVIVGEPDYNQGVLTGAGRARVYKGSASGLGTAPVTFLHGDAGAGFGASVAAAGDVDGDGFGDILIAGPTADNGSTAVAGFVQLAYGGIFGFDLSQWSRYGTQVSEFFGSSVAGAGDVNGDGHADILVGAANYNGTLGDEGQIHLYFGNQGEGLDRTTRMRRSDGTTPLAFLGKSDVETSIRVAAKCRTAAGRGKVRATFEVKELGTPFDNTNVVHSTYGTAFGNGVTFIWPVPGLSPATPYRLRVRSESRDPYFPRTAWRTLAYNSGTETDVFTGGTLLAVGDPPPTDELAFAPPAPNPARGRVTFTYSLPSPGRVTLAVYDAQGRRVAVAVGATETAGVHHVVWDVRTDRGTRAAAGVYFARLTVSGKAKSVRVVLAD